MQRSQRRPSQRRPSTQGRPAAANHSANRSATAQAHRPSQARRPAPARRPARRRRNQPNWILIAAAAALLIILLVIVISVASGGKDDVAAYNPTTRPTVSPTVAASATIAPTAAPTQAPTPEPASAYASNAQYRPMAKEGWLPVFRKAETQEKMIAITVDDCFQAENLRTIVQTAIDNDAKLTIFPIGEQVMREKHGPILKWAWENGMELENHTYTHNGLYGATDQELAKEIHYQNLALCSVLGVEYTPHFLRPKGGDARNDQRIHAYIEQYGGFKGVAHWTLSGSSTEMNKLPGTLKPGVIYLFHTTDSDTEKLKRLIPYAVQQGYKLVTLNEMFGYPENETAPLKSIEDYPIPTLQPYDKVLVPYKKTAYSYGVYELQEMLIALGYMDGKPDGIYGNDATKAMTKFQKANGLSATGEADVKSQELLIAQYNKKMNK